MISPAAASIKEANSSSSFIAPEQTCQRFTLAQIQKATNNFDEALVIGRGGFGNVYKSITRLGSANDVAIKRLQSTSSQGTNEFEAEIKILSKLHHGNLVPLIGYCCEEGKEMVLAYEFMPNGTLEDHLHRGVKKLSWLQRLKICIGVARALDYLHTGTSTQHGVIHRDVKTSNILLDSNFAAKVSDFGLAKLGQINQRRTHVSTFVKGTYGYMDPCYFYSGQLTRKSDVYAFGVVLFEVLTGKKAVDPTLDEDQWSLAVWAQDHIKQGKLDAIIDHRLKGQILKKYLKEFASIAVHCLHNDAKQRPAMAEIVVMLESILSRERESAGFGVNDGGFFNKIRYFFTRKAALLQAQSEGSTSEIIAQRSNNRSLRTFKYAELQEDEEVLVPQAELLEMPQSVQGPVASDGTPQIEVPHPMEDLESLTAGHLEVASTAENQAVEEPHASRFTWTIENFSCQTNKKLYSDVFVVGGYKWRVLIYPKGNNVDHLSMYLDVADCSSLPYGWSRYAQFGLAVVNQLHNKFTIEKYTQHHFNARESDWGFTSFIALSELYDPSRGYLLNDTCIIKADVVYDSLKDTGYVGLKNQGATVIKVARDADLLEQIGKDIYFDLVDHDKVHSFRMQEQTPFNQLKEEVAKQFGVPVEFQRFWIWAKRQNRTYRPDRPLTALEETQSVGQLTRVSNKKNVELKLLLEIEIGPDLHPLPPPEKSEEDILLFFKLYDPEKEQLRYVGRFFVKSYDIPTNIILKLNESAGFSPDEEIVLYEEIKHEPHVMCELVDKRLSFRSSQIGDGDIICFQKLPKAEDVHRYPDVPSFLECVNNRQIVHFRSLDRPKEDDFCLELSKLHTYDDVVDQVAQKLQLDDPSKIRFTSHNCYSQQPKPYPIEYRVAELLLDMLVYYNQVSDILYYEVLDIPLPELQCLKTLKVAFHHSNKLEKPVILNISLLKQSTVGDVLDEIKSKVTLSHPDSELRLLEVFNHKIYKSIPLTEKIENINDQYWTLRAEEISEEEKNLGPKDWLTHVYHFTAQNQMNFGEPFFLVIRENETLADVKVRIQRKLEVPDEEFSKWKFAFLSLGHPEYLHDSDVVSSRFQRRDVYGAWDQCLGLEHSDTIPKRSFTEN